MSAQAVEALKIANQIRFGHAAVRAELRRLKPHEALQHAADLIEQEDDRVMGMKIARILASCPRIGQVKVNMMCRYVGILSADRRLRDLTDRQRMLLTFVLRQPQVVWPSTREAA